MAEALGARGASSLLRQRYIAGASSANGPRPVCLPTTLRQQPSAPGLQQHSTDAKPRVSAPKAAAAEYAGEPPQDRLGEAARKALTRATAAVRRYGWIGFWVQVTVSVISAVILLFSVAFTSQSGPRASLYLTLIGILAGFLSTFWNFSYTRTAMKMQRYLDAGPISSVPKVKKQDVMDMVTKGVIINILGLGSTLLGIQALVGVLVAKTLSNASANPFIASAAGVYNPVLALDVFLVQAATNMLLGHFLSMVCSLWLLSVVGEGRGIRFQRFLSLKRLKRRTDDGRMLVISKGNAGKFTIDPRQMAGPGGGILGGGTALNSLRSKPTRASGAGSSIAGSSNAGRGGMAIAASSSAGSSSTSTSWPSAPVPRLYEYNPAATTVLSPRSSATTVYGGGSSTRALPQVAGATATTALAPAASASVSSLSSWDDQDTGGPLGTWGRWDMPPGMATPSGARVWDEPPAGEGAQWGSKIKVVAPSASSSSSGSSTSAAQLGMGLGRGGRVRSRGSGSRRSSAARSAFGVGSSTSSGSSSSSSSGSGSAWDRFLSFLRSNDGGGGYDYYNGRPAESLVLASRESLSYLDGSLPGDMGFDPLGLFAPDNQVGFINQRWLRYAEVIHGRWAMLGVVGCLAPEVLAYERIIPADHGVVWFKTGFLPPAGQEYDFGTDPVALCWIHMILMGFAETRRLQDFNAPGSLATGQFLPLALEKALSTPPWGDPVYPGGIVFNFMGIVESESATHRFKEKEVKHGRLAMVGMLGLFAQAAATHDGPFLNLLNHITDPFGSNILTELQYVNE